MTVPVNQNTTLVENAVEQQRRTWLNSSQVRQVDPPVDDLGQSIGKIAAPWGTARRERDQQVEVRIIVLIAARHGAVNHGKANLALSPQCRAQVGNQMPMSSEVLTLSRRQLQAPRSRSARAKGPLSSCASKRALLDAKVIR
jgi:hypothetical protein